MRNKPKISIVLATHNRRDVVLSTLGRLSGLTRSLSVETLVVDNASTDGTADAIEKAYSNSGVIRLKKNLGSCAKAFGADRAAGDIIVFLDDDSFPREGSLETMIRHFERNARLGAAGFVVHLPDGRRESSALPHVFVGCGVGLRREALEQVGGLDRGMFMQAEEYDLCFRLMGGGWDVEGFADLHVDHLKSPHARVSERTCYYDMLNNLLVTARYLPDEFESIYRADFTERYRWIAESQGHQDASSKAEQEAAARYDHERKLFAKRRLSAGVFEKLFRVEEVNTSMRELHAQGVKRTVLADLGKNIHAFTQAASKNGIEIAAIADDYFAQVGRTYRGIPIASAQSVDLLHVDAIVVSNMSPAHATRTYEYWSQQTDLPVHAWYAEGIQSYLRM